MNSSRTFTHKHGKRAARAQPPSVYLESDLGSSKPWKRKRRVRARLKALQRRVERKKIRQSLLALSIPIQELENAVDEVQEMRRVKPR